MREKDKKIVLPVEIQIEILQEVKRKLELERIFVSGLCSVIVSECCLKLKQEDIVNLFPLFTRKNAFPFRAKMEGSYWWEFGSNYDYENRLAFVNWMLSELEKQKAERSELCQ